MTIWRMRVACWITKATDTHPEYVTFIAFPMHELATALRYAHSELPAVFVPYYVKLVSQCVISRYFICSLAVVIVKF